MEIIETIKRINNLDTHIAVVLQRGGCYKFSKYLKQLYPDGIIMINEANSHTVFMYENKMYDITGIVIDDESTYRLLTDSDIENLQMNSWDSSKKIYFQNIRIIQNNTTKQQSSTNTIEEKKINKLLKIKPISIVRFMIILLFMLISCYGLFMAISEIITLLNMLGVTITYEVADKVLNIVFFLIISRVSYILMKRGRNFGKIDWYDFNKSRGKNKLFGDL